MKSKNQLHKLVLCAMIAAVYAVVSLALAPISFGNIQIRIAEALTLLPVLFPEAIGAVTLGCAITNAVGTMMGINPLGILDVFIGTGATFLAAVCTYKLRKKLLFGQPILSMLMPVLFNGLIIGAELAFVYGDGSMQLFIIFAAEVALGELIACSVLGLPMIHQFRKIKLFQDKF